MGFLSRIEPYGFGSRFWSNFTTHATTDKDSTEDEG